MEITDLTRNLSKKLTSAPKMLVDTVTGAPQTCRNVMTGFYEEGRATITDGFRTADSAVEQLADQSRKLKNLAVKNGNFAQAGGRPGAPVIHGNGISRVGEIALGGKEAQLTRGPVTVDEAISFIAENWKNSGLEPGIYNRLAILSMNGKIEVGDYGDTGNAAEYTLTGKIKVNRDVLGLKTDYDRVAADHRKNAARAGNSEQGRKQSAFAERAVKERRRELLALTQALVHEAAHAHYGFSLSKSNDEFDAYSIEAMWNAHLWRTHPEDRRILEGLDSNTISGSQAATRTPVFSKIPRR